MLCKKCGAELSDTSKFCGNCGATIEHEEEMSFGTSTEEHALNNFPQNEEPVEEENSAVDSTENEEVSLETEEKVNEEVVSNVEEVSSTVEEPIQPAAEDTSKVDTNKKKSKAPLVIAIVLLLALAGAAAYFFFMNDKSNETSIDALEKSFSNMYEKESITAKMGIDLSSNGFAMNLSGTMKYVKDGNDYKVSFDLDKSLMGEAMKFYATSDSKNVVLYIPSELFGLMELDVDESIAWFKYKLDLSEFELETNVAEDSKGKELDEKYVKYVEKKDGLRHYSLTIDKNLIEELSEEASEEELEEYGVDLSLLENFNGEIVFDFYVNDKGELSKFEVDLSKLFKDLGIEKLVFSVEFSDFNKTTVTIPSNIETDSVDLEQYLEEHSLEVDYDTYDESNTVDNLEFSF